VDFDVMLNQILLFIKDLITVKTRIVDFFKMHIQILLSVIIRLMIAVRAYMML
jgi:hypothetical protein